MISQLFHMQFYIISLQKLITHKTRLVSHFRTDEAHNEHLLCGYASILLTTYAVRQESHTCKEKAHKFKKDHVPVVI